MSVGSTVFRGGRVIDPATNWDGPGDVWIESGVIRAIDKPGAIPDSPGGAKATVVLQKGAWIVPGLIDSHVHLREPGMEYKETIETGTRAAVAGGFAAVACMANTQPVNDTPYVTAFIRERARAHAACRVYPVGAVSKGLRGEELAEIGGMVQEGARAISDDGMPVMNSYLMRKAMDYARAFDVAVISHAEDWNLAGQGVMNESALSSALGLRGSPAAAEEILVAREIALCRLTGARVHIAHLSTRLGLEHVRRAKADGLPVTAEVSPHHLALTEDAIKTPLGYDTHCKMAPPLRTAADVEALRQGLADGTIDLIATDHAPHGKIDKEVEFDRAANGIIGLQSAVAVTLELVHQGLLAPKRWVEALSLAPAKLLKVQGGRLAVGAPADLTVLDAEAAWQLREDGILSKSRNSPFVGRKFKGRARSTWIGGRKAYELA